MLQKLIAGIMIVFIMNVAIISNSNVVLAQTKGEVPGQSLGLKSDADLWRFIRNGNNGSTQMKDELAAVMIQSEGDNWRALRNGPVSVLGGIGSLPGAMLGGLLIGLIETMWSGYISIEYKDVAAFSVLIITLIFFPTGFLGKPDIEKV